MAALFKLRNTTNCKFYWRFRAINGEIVAISESVRDKAGL